jgi:TrmH RNA methyltransferase
MNEVKIYGKNAAEMAAKIRPKAIIRAYIQKTKEKEYSPLMKNLATEKKPYHIVTLEELAKITEAEHHEGVCLILKEKTPPTPKQFLETSDGLILILEDVDNPHNVGAILRVAAQFDVKKIIITSPKIKKIPAATYRTAEGGAEYVEILITDDITKIIPILKDHKYTLYSTLKNNAKSLPKIKFPKKTALILGNERKGIAPSTLKLLDQSVCIPGTGHVESLSVVTATSILSSWYYFQHS